MMIRPIACWLSCVLLTVLGSGCTRHENPSPTEGGSHPSLVCTPDSGYIGGVAAIEGMRFEVPVYLNVVTFPNGIGVRADSGTAQRIFVTVPFGAGSGHILVARSDSTGETGVFTVKEALDIDALHVAWYNLPSPITLRDTGVVDQLNFQRTWQATIRHDTVDIHRSHSSGEVFAEYHFTFIDRGANALPQLIGARIVSRWDTGSGVDTLQNGVVKIQDWNTNGALSGRFLGMLGKTWGTWDVAPRLTFYVTAGNILR